MRYTSLAFVETLLLTTSALSLLVWDAKPARADLLMPTIKDQLSLGDKAAKDVEKRYRVIHNTQSERILMIGQSLLAKLSPTDRTTWHWSFELIQSKQINAFALPGGHTFFFTGLIGRLQTDDEIAGVMAHEMTHVRKQHWAHQVAATLKRELGLKIILGLAHASSSWQEMAGLGDTLLNLRYSRHDEEQADIEGLKNMIAAGYNPNGMLQLMHILQSSAGSSPPEFLSDHPITSHRITVIRDTIIKLGYTVKSND